MSRLEKGFRPPPDLLVHVVGAHDDARVLQEHVGKRTPLGARVRGAGRIAGGVDEQQARLRRDRRLQLPRHELVALRCGADGRHGQAVGQQHHVGVAHPVWCGNDGFITRVEHGHAEVVDSLLGARAHQNLVALVADLIVALELRDDRVLELDDAVDVRVTREAFADRLDTRVGNVRGRIEVRFAGAEPDDVFALGFQFRGARGDCESGRRLDALNASESWLGTGEPFIDWKKREGLGCPNGRVYYAIRFDSPRLTERLNVMENKPFVLKADYEPAADQPQAIAKLVEGIKDGFKHQTLLGVTGSGKTYSIGNVIQHVQRPTLVMAHNKTLAAQLYGEFKEFFPENSVEYFVSYYDYYQPEAYVPSSDTYIEKDASINEHIEQMRL